MSSYSAAGRPVPETDWRFALRYPDGGRVTFEVGATAARVAETIKRDLADRPDRLIPPSPEAAEPFADRDRWCAILGTNDGGVEPDPARYFAALGESDESYAAGSVLDEYEPDDLEVLVVRRSAMPVADDGTWRSPGSYDGADVAIELTDFDSIEQAEQAWLMAVDVAAGRNQRAGAGK